MLSIKIDENFLKNLEPTYDRILRTQLPAIGELFEI